MTIQRTIRVCYDCNVGEHNRFRSWEHCYNYFRGIGRQVPSAQIDQAAIQLGFYLASWGMYRGSGFLLQHAYTVHRDVIDMLGAERYDALWNTEFGSSKTDEGLLPVVDDLIKSIRQAYEPFAPAHGSSQPTDTFVTKVILGTFGCLPAVDRYFISGFKRTKLRYSHLNARFIERVLDFSLTNLSELKRAQAYVERKSGMRYPLMKLVDMYFWRIGFEKSKKGIEERRHVFI